MLLVNELLFAYFSIGPSSKFNLWDYCYDDIQQRIPYSHHYLPSCFASELDFSEIDPPRLSKAERLSPSLRQNTKAKDCTPETQNPWQQKIVLSLKVETSNLRGEATRPVFYL